ncbi:MAG: serine/threonine protein kinase, partial [Alcanivoracaceae bacterium]|nr:serine/threonine protein kinase [Alcanivoracaceae bacterium]
MFNLEKLSQENFIKAKQLFTQAIELDPADIIEFVKSHCKDSSELYSAVISLVNMHNDSGGATITPKKPLTERLNKEQNISAGYQIGKFIIEKPIGSGGMGDVYLANRADDEVQQKVAIKVLKNKLNQSVYERFQIEKRILAHLEHPGIARLIDTGISDGMIYYVMEYVEGLAIDDYCQQNKLTVKQRLRLFIKICEVVSYAHANLIIHRDLKPPNILVTDEGQVKLLDFGIAKPLQQLPGLEEVPQTIQGNFALTPQYAAPEQFKEGVIGTACDVYALGLLLYELLTGTLAQDLTGLSLTQIEQVITNKIPVNASKQVTQQDVDTESFKLKKPVQLKNLLKGDIDSIINHAIKKEPQKRYKSVADLSEDINNHLQFNPISVRGNHQAYRLKKYLRRNWLPVTAIIGLVSILSFSTYFIGQERDKAIHEKHVAEQVTDFLVETFKNADPTKTQGEKITAKEILEEGIRQINNQQDSQIKNKLLLTMGEVYFHLGHITKSEKILNQIGAIVDVEMLIKKNLLTVDIYHNKQHKSHRFKVIELMNATELLIDNNEKILIKIIYRKLRAYHYLGDFKNKERLADKMLALAKKHLTPSSVEHA